MTKTGRPPLIAMFLNVSKECCFEPTRPSLHVYKCIPIADLESRAIPSLTLEYNEHDVEMMSGVTFLE